MSQTELFSDQQLEVVRFCAVECEMQRSGEASVWDMVSAWNWAMRARGGGKPTVAAVLRLGALVDPIKNSAGLREVGVRVGWDVKMEWSLVPKALDNLIASEDLPPAEWFREYEDIHPFRDGNGRTGQILFNWLSGSLRHKPKWAPNFWDDPRRKKGWGA